VDTALGLGTCGVNARRFDSGAQVVDLSRGLLHRLGDRLFALGLAERQRVARAVYGGM